MFHTVSIITFIFGTFLLKSEVWTLRLTGLDVPSVAIMGSSVWLNCSYDLEADQLYSIKWYRNDQEFYRFLPNDQPPAQVFATKGLRVDLHNSHNGSVRLIHVDLQTDGVFRCEVSAEAPSFQTVRKEKEMRVYYLPKEDPVIEGTRSEYHIGDTINVSCKAGPSKPAAKLMWFINDNAAPESYLREVVVDTPLRVIYEDNGFDGLKTSFLYLKFTADRFHFVNAIIKLRCTAVISQVFSRHQEVIARDEDRVRLSKTANYESDAPIITGVKQKYSVGDLVNATCTSRRSKPGAQLIWYINDAEADAKFTYRYKKLAFTDGSEITILRLEFIVTPMDYTPSNEMRLKCAATLFKVINTQSMETTINGYSGLMHSKATLDTRCEVRLIIILVVASLITALRDRETCTFVI